ncbi:MAG: hypothetical protein ACE5E0_05820, partial [Terriglobia bacterium]
MSKALGQLLEEHSEQIISTWAERLKGMEDTGFADHDLDRLKTTWAKGFEAYLSAIKDGKYSLIRNFIER